VNGYVGVDEVVGDGILNANVRAKERERERESFL